METNPFYKEKNESNEFYDKIHAFLVDKQEPNQDILNKLAFELHENDINVITRKDFCIDVKEINDHWGTFWFDHIDTWENQNISLNCLNYINNTTYKKALFIVNYLHETSHEKQRDMYLYNSDNKILEVTDFNKYLNLELFYRLDYVLETYEQRLVEIDAIYNGMKRCDDLLKSKIIPTCIETLMPNLYCCVRYIASINMEKHHVYFPDKYSLNADKLIEYYKDFYNESRDYCSVPRLIEISDVLTEQKKSELLQINYDNVKSEINRETSFVMSCLNKYCDQLLNLYKPSKQLLSLLKIDENNWGKYVKSQNKVKIAAIMCDDLHCQYTNAERKFMKSENELEMAN